MKTSTILRSAQLSAIFALVLFTSCMHAQPVKQEDRTISEFTSIKAGGAFEITLTQADNHSVKIEAQEDVIHKIKTEVKGSTLHIFTSGRIENEKPMKIFITVKQLNGLNISGASTVKSASVFKASEFSLQASGAATVELALNAGKLTLDASGASHVELEGTATTLDADLSGASNLSASGLHTDSAVIDASGASNASINTKQSIDAEASGASSITYTGEPANKKVSSSGASSISKKGA